MGSGIKKEDIARFDYEALRQEIILSKDSQQLEDYDPSDEYDSREQPAKFESYEKAYTGHQWFYAAACRIAESGAQIPMKLFQWNKGKGSGIEITDHPLLDLFEKPSAQMSGYDLKEATFAYQEITGNAYWEKVPMKKGDLKGELKELFPIRPSKLVAVPSRKKRVLRYEYGSKPVIYEPEQIVHFRKFNPLSALYGLAPMIPLRNSVLSDLYAQKWNMNIFKQGGKMSGLFSTDQHLSDDSFKRNKEALKAEYAGADNAHKFIFSDGGVKFQELGKDQKDMEYPKLRETNFEEISGGMTVYPIILGILRNANYSNAETQMKLFWTLGMIPRAWKFASVISTQICPHYGDDLYVEPDLEYIKNLLRDENKERELDVSEVNAGIVTRDEVRAKRGLEPVKGGNVIYIPWNSVPLGGESQNANEKTTKELKREAIWKAFDRSLIPFEEKFAKMVASFHRKIEKEVLGNVDEHYKPKGKSTAKMNSDNMLFDLDKAIADLEKLSTKNYKEVVDYFGNKAVKEIEKVIDFNLSDPKVVDYLNVKPFEFADEVLKTIQARLREELGEGYAEGESIADIRVRVQDVFEGTVRGEKARANMIARTEIVSAANQSSLLGYKQVGVEKKMWISTIDQFSRPDHAAMNGTTIDIDADFNVGDTSMNAPGDPKGGAENNCNCRCVISAGISEE